MQYKTYVLLKKAYSISFNYGRTPVGTGAECSLRYITLKKLPNNYKYKQKKKKK